MSPDTKQLLGMWLIFGGFIPGVLIGAVANWAAKHRKLAQKGTPRYRNLLTLEVITTVLTLAAVGLVGVLSIIRIGAV